MQPFSPISRPALAPPSTSSLNCKPTASQGKKRKHDELESHQHELQTFTATPLPTITQSSPIAFSSVVVIARSHVPLAWLDTRHVRGGFLFQSSTLSTPHADTVLVAQKAPNGGLYAIERAGANIFVACALHNWVTQDWCKSAASGNIPRLDVELLMNENDSSRGHTRTGPGSGLTTPLPPPSPKPKNRRGALARKSILTPKESPNQDGSLDLVSPAGLEQNAPDGIQVLSTPRSITPIVDVRSPNLSVGPVASSEPPTTPDRLTTGQSLHGVESTATSPEKLSMDQLRQNYLEHLYLSKTSLAFYAKGPLSRARAHAESVNAMPDLMEFYEHSILSAKKIDLKYKESLLRVIQDLPVGDGDDMEQYLAPIKKKGRKKIKLGKDCLWPGEDEYIIKWWHERDWQPRLPGSESALSEELRKATGEVRMREIKMQLLLILEVMLLQLALSSKPAETPFIPPDPEIKAESVEVDMAEVLAKTAATKNKRDWTNKLDTIVDRLCIWHTVGADELLLSETSNSDHLMSKKDGLRDFCKDVLVPFYTSKLPEQVKMICVKLGGPEILPQRPPVQQQTQKSRSSRVVPGSAATVRRKTLTRTLERVLSEDQGMRHASPPVLSRSSTVPLMPRLQRESSDRPISRGGMSKSVSFSNREVDLEADAKAQQAKRKKLDQLALQKQELKEAIDALKKPNRTNAAKTFMDDVEQRRMIEKKPMDKRSDHSVQIMATPKRVRSRPEPDLPPVRRPMLISDEAGLVPSSASKPGAGNPGSTLGTSQSSTKKRAVLTAVHDTPSRPRAKMSNPLGMPNTQSVEIISDSVVHATPVSHRQWSDLAPEDRSQASPLRMSKSQRPVLVTPLKKSDVRIESVFRDAPEIPENAGKAMDRVMGGRGGGLGVVVGMSIYDRLGWNDDFDL